MEPDLMMQGLISLTASIAGVKVAMNGIYKRLDRHETKLDESTEKLYGFGERIARIEAQQIEERKPRGKK
jgi:hypothetical protein